MATTVGTAASATGGLPAAGLHPGAAPPVQGGTPSPPMNDILPIKPLVDIPVGLPPWAWALIAAVLVAALAGAWFWYRRRKGGEEGHEPDIPPVPPHLAAFGALRDLDRDAGSLSDREYYFRLTLILRGYLEDRLGFPAREMTVQEILPVLAEAPGVPAAMRTGIGHLLEQAEPVKFAGAAAGVEKRHGDLARTEEAIRAVEAAMAAVEEGAPPSPEASDLRQLPAADESARQGEKTDVQV